jgi:hypothetical protein
MGTKFMKMQCKAVDVMQLKLIKIQHIPSRLITKQQHDALIEKFINKRGIEKLLAVLTYDPS